MNFLTRIIIAATAFSTILFPVSALSQEIKTVAVSQIVEHPALDACRQGLLDGLTEAGFIDGKNLRFIFQTAQGNPATALQIAKQFVGENPDVLVGIATPSAQALAASTTSIPIIYSAVTDPISAKLLDYPFQNKNNVTGLSDLSPVYQHLKIMQEIIPNLKSIGVVYNPGEANAVSLLNIIKENATRLELEIVEGIATRTSEVSTATQAIANQVDIFYAITDNTIASAIAALVKSASTQDKAVFGAATSYVDEGAIAAVGFNYYQVGRQTADYVVSILEGTNVSDLPPRIAKGTDIVINPKVAAQLKITLPPSLTTEPSRIVE